MSTFRYLCEKVERTSPPVELIDEPYNDLVQQAWLNYFEKQSLIPQATSREDLERLFIDDAALLTTIYRNALIDERRHRLGIKKDKTLLSLEEEQLLIDQTTINERLADLTEEQLQAVDRFTIAWLMQERGEVIPSRMAMQLSRDRKKTGLPLVLRRGNGGEKRKRQRNDSHATNDPEYRDENNS